MAKIWGSGSWFRWGTVAFMKVYSSRTCKSVKVYSSKLPWKGVSGQKNNRAGYITTFETKKHLKVLNDCHPHCSLTHWFGLMVSPEHRPRIWSWRCRRWQEQLSGAWGPKAPNNTLTSSHTCSLPLICKFCPRTHFACLPVHDLTCFYFVNLINCAFSPLAIAGSQEIVHSCGPAHSLGVTI